MKAQQYIDIARSMAKKDGVESHLEQSAMISILSELLEGKDNTLQRTLDHLAFIEDQFKKLPVFKPEDV